MPVDGAPTLRKYALLDDRQRAVSPSEARDRDLFAPNPDSIRPLLTLLA